MIKRLQIAGKNGYRRREFQKNAFLYLMALPAVLYLFINNYMPLVGLRLRTIRLEAEYLAVNG